MKLISREQLDRAVVVWIARVSQAPNPLSCLDFLLDEREIERAARFRFAEDRARFVLGRSLVRHGLGSCLDRKPEEIKLGYGDRDQPIFPEEESLQFSISHTRDIVAVALTAGARVGIDFEFIKDPVDLPALAKRILSETDWVEFKSLAQPEKLPAFFRVWTRKESYLKALGEGIAEGLKEVSVPLDHKDVGMLTDSRDPSGSVKWRLHHLAVSPEYMGCVACDSPQKHVECFEVCVKKVGHNSDIELTTCR